jgi:long-chain acyl-CoA synthetase
VWTFKDVETIAAQIGAYLEAQEITSGERIIILARNSPWWVSVFIACLFKDIVVVPIDFNSSNEFIEKIIAKTKPRMIFASDMRGVSLKTVLPIVDLEDLPTLLKNHAPIALVPTQQEHSLLEIVFTSGSTGDPKGVCISHKNLYTNVTELLADSSIPSSSTMLSLVPLSHMLEQNLGCICPFVKGIKVVYPTSIRPIDIRRSLQKEKISHTVTVPAFLRSLKEFVEREAEKSGDLKRLHYAQKRFAYSPLFIKKIIFRNIHKKLGGNLVAFFVGGAPLTSDIENFWNNIGVHVVQGYGLTEASPFVSVNTFHHRKPQSVGRVLGNLQMRIQENGEIDIKGDNVTQGYFEDEAATQERIVDGWYKTGDLGYLDKDGYLFLKGRKKNMILSASGLNVYPEDIESVLSRIPKVRESVVIGVEKNNETIITAVLLLAQDAPSSDSIMREANGQLSSHEYIQEVVIWPEADFPRTPTRKIIRAKIIEHIAKNQSVDVSDTLGTFETPLVKILASALQRSVGSIKPEHNLTTDLNVDSLKRLEIVSRIEEELGIYVSEEKIGLDTTVENLETLLLQKNQTTTLYQIPHWPMHPLVASTRTILQAFFFIPFQIMQRLHITSAPLPIPYGPVIFIANHESHLDTETILRALPWHYRIITATAAAKDYFFQNRVKAFLGRLFFAAIPVDRDSNVRETLTSIGTVIDQGYSLIIYPEGTRSTTGTLNDFQKGIGLIAQEMQVPIVPIRIIGNAKLLPKGSVFPRFGTTKVVIGKHITIDPHKAYDVIARELQEIIENLS